MLYPEEIDKELPSNGKEIWTPDGWRAIRKVYRTVPMRVWHLRTNSYSLECSGYHLVRSGDNWRYVCDLTVGDVVNTVTGMERVEKIYDTDKERRLYDIEVDHPDGMYYSDGILSHNSTTICARQLILSHIIKQYRGLYVAPSFPMMETYAARYQEMEAVFRTPTGKQNKYSKTYANNSKLDFAYCLESARDVRGKSVEEITVDECVSYDTILLRRGDNLSVDIPTRICDIAVGDCVVSFTDEGSKTYDRVTAKQYKGMRECYLLLTESGRSIKATGNHRVFTNQGKLYVSEVRDRVCSCGRYGIGGGESGARLFGEEQKRSHDGAGNFTWGWLHTESSGVLVQEEVGSAAVFRSEGLRCSESSTASWSWGEYEHTRESRVCEGTFVCSLCRHEDVTVDRTILVYVLQSPGDSVGWFRQNEEICVSRMGGSARLGSYSMVGAGRWEHNGSQTYFVDQFILGGRSGSTCCLVQEEWCFTWSREDGVCKRSDRCSRFYNSFFYDSYSLCIEEDSSLCARFDDVQIGFGRQVRADGLRTLRKRVLYHDAESQIYAGEASCVLRELSAGCDTRVQRSLQRKDREGRAEEKVARGEEEVLRKGSEECEKVLRDAQGKCGGESQSEETRSGRKKCCHSYGGDVFHMRETLQDGFEDVRSSETLRIFCVPGRGLSEEKDGKPSCKIACEEEGGEALRYEEVVEVVPCGVMPVYDITTERTHRFLADGMLVSNCQNLNPDILPEILYTQTMAKLPMTIYTGTALTTDTLLEQKWRESSMGMWHVRAMDNKHWLNMFDKDVLAKVCDNPLGPVCPYTGKRLDVTRGSFVHANKQAMEAGNIGLHIPQCIITDIANSPVQWGKVYNHIKHDDWNKVLQECFGIAVEEGTREISQQDLLRACVLKDTQEGLKLKCNRGYYRLIISGCDWGGSDYNPSTKTKTSYTVHCIMGVAPDGGVDIVHYRRYSGMNYPEIARQIAIDHRAYNGQVIASDFGVGMAYNFEIRKYFPLDRHFVMEYTNPWAPAISLPKGAHMHNQLLINRTEALTNVFRDLKRPVPMIRCRCWEDMSPYLLDWLNMFRVVQESTSGKKSFLYRRPPTKADDALHAFTFAYVLVKFYRGESLIDDSNLVQRINAVLRSPRRESPTVQEFTRAVLGDMPWSIPIN